MAANLNPIFTLTPRADTANFSAANTARDGSGVLNTVASAGANGTLINSVRVNAQSTTTAGMVRLFVHNGTTGFLWHEIPVTAITPGVNVAAFEAEYVPQFPLCIPSGYALKATTHNAESFNVSINGGDF
jgi:hypothetical protein